MKSRFPSAGDAVLAILFGIAILFFSAEALSLTCSVGTSCSNVVVFKLSNNTGGHAELPSQSNYAYSVCCSEPGTTLNNTCTGNNITVLKLSDVTNAHVEEASYTDYGNSACMSSSNGTLNCQYSSSCSSIGSSYNCLASISDVTNAHVGDCSAYSTKVCCAFLTSVTHNLVFQLNESVAWWGDSLLASGTLADINNRPLSGVTVSVNLSSQAQCSGSTNALGSWSCFLTAPMASGTYTYTAFTNLTAQNFTLIVAPNYGTKPSGTLSRGVVTLPVLMQERDGTIRIENILIMAYRTK